MGRDEGWLAEHMLILGVESPDGEKTYVAAAFPSACGKTNFAMMQSRRRRSTAGRSRPSATTSRGSSRAGTAGSTRSTRRAGFFGVAPGTNATSNPNAMEAIARDTIFTNVALTPDGDVWWEGMTEEPPARLIDWRGEAWTPDCGPARRAPERPLHRARCSNAPRSIRALGRSRRRARSAAFIFGGRMSRDMPLVFQAFNWTHGVYMRGHHGLRGDGGRRGPGCRRCAATRWRCCPSAATTWPTTSRTGSASGAASRTRRESSA